MGFSGFLTPLDGTNISMAIGEKERKGHVGHIRWFDVPSTQIELDYRDKTFDGIVNGGHGEQGLRVCHEAGQKTGSVNCGDRPIAHRRVSIREKTTYLVIRSSIERGSRMNVGKTTRLKSAPGRSCEMMWDRTECRQCRGQRHLGHGGAMGIPFPWSGSTWSSSALTGDSSMEERPRGVVSDMVEVVEEERTYWPKRHGGVPESA